MTAATQRLLQEALALPDDEREEFVVALLASSADPRELPFDPAWLDEARRRSAKIDSGAVPMTPWSVVRERVRKRLEGRPRG